MTLPAPRRTLRRRRLARTGALSGALLLALTACAGGGADSGASSASTTTTAPAASSTSAAASSSTGGASASESDATTSGAAGEYVPASSKGPAQNVPKPVMPAAVKENTPEGAEAAVKYWWEAVNYLQQTNDPEPLKSISAKDCNICASYPKSIKSIYSADGWHTGSQPMLESVRAEDKGSWTYLTMLVSQKESTAFDKEGRRQGSSSAESITREPWKAAATFDPDQGQWMVRDVSVVTESGQS